MVFVMSIRVRDGIRALLYCRSVPDPELSSKIVELVWERGRVPVKELSSILDVSYPLILRLVNDMSSMGILLTDREKPQGRGRSKKVVEVNKGGLLEMVNECISVLEELKRVLK